MRADEAVHLTWPDIDFDDSTIRVVAKPELDGLPAWHPKDYQLRRIPVPDLTIDLLTRLHANADEGSRFIFLATNRVAWIRQKRESGQWSEGQAMLNNLDRNFKRIAGRAKVGDVSLHDLRRSAISHWARQMPAAVVKESAGHASIETTLKYYVKIRAEDMAQAREVTASVLRSDPILTQIG